ncbi:MAG TPA: dephospho-CoA kinase [Actinomycetota bacterium]|nr:dephospho-CoA kinase [Actinomycetota bacterium]
MLFAGITGGIGSGKSTFVALLAERGVQVIDADLLAKDALKTDRPAWHSVVDQFGDEVLVPGSMEIDRKRLAEIVFNDRNKLAALNAIVHPVIFAGIADALERLRATDAIVVLDAALMVETGLHKTLDVLIVVVTSPDTRRERLKRSRAMTTEEIDARIAAQADQDGIVRLSDMVVWNDGSLDDLVGEADRVFGELTELQAKHA